MRAAVGYQIGPSLVNLRDQIGQIVPANRDALRSCELQRYEAQAPAMAISTECSSLWCCFPEHSPSSIHPSSVASSCRPDPVLLEHDLLNHRLRGVSLQRPTLRPTVSRQIP